MYVSTNYCMYNALNPLNRLSFLPTSLPHTLPSYIATHAIFLAMILLATGLWLLSLTLCLCSHPPSSSASLLRSTLTHISHSTHTTDPPALHHGVATYASHPIELNNKAIPHNYHRNFVFGSCTDYEYYDWYYNTYDAKCRYLFWNRTYEEERYVIYCDGECGPPYLQFLAKCGGEVGDFYAKYYRNLCQSNEKGVPCVYFFLATELLQPTQNVEAYCELPYQNGTQCSYDCYVALFQLKHQLGCCVNNIYNYTVPSDVAQYAMWDACSISTPGVCGGAGQLVQMMQSALILIGVFVTLAVI